MSKTLLGTIIFFFIQIPVLTFARDFPSTSGIKSDMRFGRYQLKTKDCAFNLFAAEGGQVFVDSWLENRSLFSEKSDARGAALMPDFHCVQESARTYCLDTWTQSVLDTEPVMKAAINVKRYDHFHHDYFSLAFAANTNATNPPRPRTLHFCLGTDFQVVEGAMAIGTEKSHKALQALKILKTLQFK